MREVTLQRAPRDAAGRARPRRIDIGLDWRTVDTPALLVDLDRLDAQHRLRWPTHARAGGVALRPHFKTHKSVAIARRQLAAGAVGITVAKLDEAEALVDGGIDAPDPARLPDRGRARSSSARSGWPARVPLTLAVDSADGARPPRGRGRGGRAASLDVWIEIDSGLQRCGVAAGRRARPRPARRGSPELRLTGMFTHAGQSYAARDAAEVAAIAAAEAAAVVEAATATRAIGIPIETVSAGSTPTARFLDGASGITEIRPGTYVFYDALQVALGSTDRGPLRAVGRGDRRQPAGAGSGRRRRRVQDVRARQGRPFERPARPTTGRSSTSTAPSPACPRSTASCAIPADSPLAIGDRIRIVPEPRLHGDEPRSPVLRPPRRRRSARSSRSTRRAGSTDLGPEHASERRPDRPRRRRPRTSPPSSTASTPIGRGRSGRRRSTRRRRRRVEQDEVRDRARRDPAAVDETEGAGRHPGHPVDRRRQVERAALADVAARGRGRTSRTPADGRAPRAMVTPSWSDPIDGRRVGDDRVDVGLGHERHDHHRRAAVGDHRVEGEGRADRGRGARRPRRPSGPPASASAGSTTAAIRMPSQPPVATM